MRSTLARPARDYAHKDFPLLQADSTVEDALEKIRREGIGERVVYFYAVDESQRLIGVIPTRRLLTAAPVTRLREIMVPRVVALPAEATVLEACEFFVLYKFLAFPLIDRERHVLGVIDADVLRGVCSNRSKRRREQRARIFSKLSGFTSRRSAMPRRGERFVIAFPGFSCRLEPAQFARSWPVPSRGPRRRA